MIDKSARQHYVIQGKVKNYLGKQKMVKAPKKWKSGPDHPDTELAYITKAEKDALVKMNLHGSMNGKAHKGPSGIISLNGWGDADRGYDSPSSGGHDHGGSGDDWHQSPAYNQPAPAPAPSPRAAGAESIGIDPTTGASTHVTDTTVQDPERYPSIKPKLPVAVTGGVEPTSMWKDAGQKAKDFTKNRVKAAVRNKIMKELGLAGLNPLIGIGSWLLGKFAPGKKAALTEKLKSTIKPAFDKDIPKVADRHPGTGKKKRTTPTDDRDGVNRILPETLQSAVSEGTQQYLSDEMKQQYAVAQNKMKAVLASGYYTDQDGRQIQLSDEQVNALTQWVTKIDGMLVDPVMYADGGRVDKALGGRVRDI